MKQYTLLPLVVEFLQKQIFSHC